MKPMILLVKLLEAVVSESGKGGTSLDTREDCIPEAVPAVTRVKVNSSDTGGPLDIESTSDLLLSLEARDDSIAFPLPADGKGEEEGFGWRVIESRTDSLS